jgi:hypothetical protein
MKKITRLRQWSEQNLGKDEQPMRRLAVCIFHVKLVFVTPSA